MTLQDITPQWNASDQMRICLMAKDNVISVCHSWSATKCSILKPILTSLHAPCHILTLIVLQLNAANATTYQKAPPIGMATKSQKRHDFNNWVYFIYLCTVPPQDWCFNIPAMPRALLIPKGRSRRRSTNLPWGMHFYITFTVTP